MNARTLPFVFVLGACASSVTAPPPDAPPADAFADAADAAHDVVADAALDIAHDAADDAPPDRASADAAPAASDAAPDAPPDATRDAPADLDPCGGLTLCGGVCRDTGFDARHCGRCDNACPAAQECVRGACVMAPCAAPSVACNGACVDPQSDRANCGACGCACPAGSFCAAGNCVVGCPAGLTVCGRVTCGGDDAGLSISCRDLSTDRANCGACGNACPMEQFCQAGACRAP